MSAHKYTEIQLALLLIVLSKRYIELDDRLDEEPANHRKKKNIEDNLFDDIIINQDLNVNFNKERAKRNTYTSLQPFRSVARLLISIETRKVSDLRAANQQENKKLNMFDGSPLNSTNLTSSDQLQWNPLMEAQTAKTDEFVAFAIISEVSMIDYRFKKGPISFQLCIG